MYSDIPANIERIPILVQSIFIKQCTCAFVIVCVAEYPSAILAVYEVAVYIFLQLSLTIICNRKEPMVALRVFLLVLGMFFILLGLVFMIASADTNLLPRLAVGISMLAVGVYLLRKGIREHPDKTVVISRTIELSGDVNLENMTCDKCGAGLSSKNISLKAGAVFVSCPYCGMEYQIEEKPKW